MGFWGVGSSAGKGTYTGRGQDKGDFPLSCSLAGKDWHLKCETSGFENRTAAGPGGTSWPGGPHRDREPGSRIFFLCLAWNVDVR